MSCEQTERLSELALSGLPADEARRLEEHAAGCPECRTELAALRRLLDAFVAWPVDILQPPALLRSRLLKRIGEKAEPAPGPVTPVSAAESGAAWEHVAPGISCKRLATDLDRQLVSMLVRMAPNADYPPHRHAAVEELHLLDGELWIEDRKLCAGDYRRVEPGSIDGRVWTETGCTCVVITSLRDELV